MTFKNFARPISDPAPPDSSSCAPGSFRLGRAPDGSAVDIAALKEMVMDNTWTKCFFKLGSTADVAEASSLVQRAYRLGWLGKLWFRAVNKRQSFADCAVLTGDKTRLATVPIRVAAPAPVFVCIRHATQMPEGWTALALEPELPQ